MSQNPNGTDSNYISQRFFSHKTKRNSLPDIFTKPKLSRSQHQSLPDDPRMRRLQVIMRLQSIAYSLYCRHTTNVSSEQHSLQLMSVLMHKIQKQRDSERFSGYKWAGNFRFSVFKCMNDPKSSRMARVFDMMISLAALVSVSATCFETSSDSTDEWLLAEAVCTLLFTFEFLARFLSCVAFREFATWLSFVDIITIVPSYIEFLLPFLLDNNETITNSIEFRAIRSLRVLRILKIARHFTWIPMVKEVLRESWLPLAMMGFMVGIILVVLSSIMYFIEKDSPNSLFISIPTSMYFCMITLTTVGYGDIVPVTPLGKFFAACVSIIGILLLAIPISIVSESFQTLYTRREELIVFVDRYRKRNECVQQRQSHQDKLQWMIHIAHEISAFTTIYKLNRQIHADDHEVNLGVKRFFAESLADDGCNHDLIHKKIGLQKMN